MDEHYIYGSDRIGTVKYTNFSVDRLQRAVTGYSANLDDSTYLYTFTRGNKIFELTNHLGNVSATTSDRRTPIAGAGGLVSGYSAVVNSLTDYSPFGMALNGRVSNIAGNYRYGFNGQEMDNQIYGNGNSYNAEFWQYDPRVGRRWNVDPLVKDGESPYAAFANNPIWFVDKNGADTSMPSLINRLDDIIFGGAGKNQRKKEILQAAIKNEREQVVINRNLKEHAFDDMMTSKSGSEDFKKNVNLFNEYLSNENLHSANLGTLIEELYKTQRDGYEIKKYNDFVNTSLDLANLSFTTAGVVASLIPTGGSSGLFMSSTEIRASLFSAKSGYGLFGKDGLKVAGYKIEAMYATPRVGYGTGTILSIKQMGRQGGNLLRWDYGVLHGTTRTGLHSTFRLNVGKGFGSSGQYPWYAPFKFWNYPR